MRKSRKFTIVIGSTGALAWGRGVRVLDPGQLGNGSGSTGTTNAITVNQTSVVTGLYPGGPAQDLSGDFDNPNPGAVGISRASRPSSPASPAAVATP